MAKLTKEERLAKIIEQISNETETIRKSKEKIKSLNLTKKKLEAQIQNDKFSELKDVLKDYGINSVPDFQNFIDNYSNPKTSTYGVESNENADGNF